MSLMVVTYLLLWYIVLHYDFLSSQLDKTLVAYSILPICICYLLFRWGAPLLWIWNTKIGKLVYVLASAIIYAISKTFADKAISSTLQSSANHFPNAQNALTLYFLIFGILALAGIAMQLIYFLVAAFMIVIGASLLVVRMMITDIAKAILLVNPDMNNWYIVELARSISQKMNFRTISVFAIDTFIMLLCGTFVIAIPSLIEHPSWLKDESGQFVSLPKQILVWSSFYPNMMSNGVKGEFKRLVCSNLPPDVNVSAANPNDIIPHDVILAEIKKGKRQASENAYNYRLSKCENTNDPDHVRG